MDPEEPLPSDCCGSACSPCVFDIYRQRQRDNQTGANHSSDYIRTDLLSETRFKPFRLLKKLQIADGVIEFRFQPVDKVSLSSDNEVEINGVLPYSVGQHLFLRCCKTEIYEEDDQLSNKINTNSVFDCTSNKDSKRQIIIRAYTPITIATEEKNCCFNIFVKLYDNGMASNYLRNSSVGDTLYWRGPYGLYKYIPNSFSYILMLCVGSGLAPMISVINSILNNDSDDTIVHLKCGFKNMNRIILRNELKRMAKFWNFTFEYYLSEKTDLHSNVQFGEQIKYKRIDKNSVKEYIENKPREEIFLLVCGTECFTLELKNIISELNFNVDTNVHIF